jgi:cytochrome c-type biogenesis protein CcmF
VGAVAAVVLVALGYASNPVGAAAVALCAFVTAAILLEFWRGAAARRALAGGSWPRALVSLIARNRRRYGGYVVHLAVVLLVLGITGSSAYSTVHSAQLRPGETLAIRDYRLTYLRTEQERGPNFTERKAVFAVRRGGEQLGTLAPARRTYLPSDQPSNEVAIRTDRGSGEDLFVILNGVGASSASVKVLVNPLVNLIWLAAIVFVIGAAITVWPDAREARRLARRYAEEPVASEA